MRLWFVSPHAGDEWINGIKVAKEMEVHWLIDRNVRFDISCFALTWSRSERNHIRSPPNVGQLQEGLTMLEVNQGDYGRSAKDVVVVEGNGTHSSALIWRAGEGTCGVLRNEHTARTFSSPPNECWRMRPISLYGDYILGRPMNVDSARFQAPCRPILHLFTLGIIVGGNHPFFWSGFSRADI